MTISRSWAIGIGVVLALAIVLGGYELLQEHDARLKSETNQVEQKALIEVQQTVIDQAKADRIQTASDLKTQLAAITNQRTIVITPQQAVAAIPTFIPNLPQPVVVQTVPATATAPTTSQIVIPAADIPAFQKYKLDCDESSARLMACSKDTINFQTEVTATQDQYKAMTKERDSQKARADGGTFWHRVGHDALQITISGAVGYAVGKLSK